jgi:hypothetical protein
LEGFINIIQKVFPIAERSCARHMIYNFQRAVHRGETLKNDMWVIARAINNAKWQKNMDKLKVDNDQA